MNEPLIIHFTPKLEFLKSILSTESLKVRYCKEIFCLGNRKISSAAHPMVCFSAYSKQELQDRKITYGKYGVAFTKNWAESKNMSPVIYIEKSSQAANALAALLRARQNKINSDLPSNLRLPIIQLKCFTKNTRGFNSKLNLKDFDFTSENEWRYVPTKKLIGNGLISEDLSKFLKKELFYNQKLAPYPLRFETADLVTVFVSDEEEKIQIVEATDLAEEKVEIFTWRTE